MKVELVSLKPVTESSFANRVGEKIECTYPEFAMGSFEIVKVSELDEEDTYALVWHFNEGTRSNIHIKAALCRTSTKSLKDFAKTILKEIAPEQLRT